MSYTKYYITVFQAAPGISVITCSMFVTEIRRTAQTFRETAKATVQYRNKGFFEALSFVPNPP